MGGNFKDHGGDFATDIQDGVATLTWTRPTKANAYNPRMIAPMKQFFIEIRHNPEVRVLLISGQGKHFMAGGDLESLGDLTAMTEAERYAFGSGAIEEHNSMIREMMRVPAPIVASVQGGVAGAGLGFLGSCDFVIAADTAFFWAAHILHGGSNDGMTTYFLPRQVGLRKALEMALLGDRIKAPEAKELGLINFVVPEADLKAETDKLVARLRKGPTAGYGKIKKLMYASLQNSMDEQGALEALTYGEAVKTEDVPEGLKSFFQKREPNFKGR